MQVKINESVDSFRVLREGGFYYVDKSLMLKEFLEDNGSIIFSM